MANSVAPGYLKIKDEEKLDRPPEKGVLNIKSKNFKIGGNKGGSGIAGGKAPKVLIKNKTPLQPEASSMEWWNFPNDLDIYDSHRSHDHCKYLDKSQRRHIALRKAETALELHNVLPKEESGLVRMKRLMREMKDKDTCKCKCELDDYSEPYRLFISSPSSSDSTPSPSPQNTETCESVLKEGIGAQIDPIIQ